MTTKATTDEYKGNKLFAIYKENEKGDLSEWPVVSFGKTKAQALLNHYEDFEAWCAEQGIKKQD